MAVYVALGGLRSAIFNEVLQFMLIWPGALLIPILGLIEAGGWSGIKQRSLTNAAPERLHPPLEHARLLLKSHGYQLDRHRLRSRYRHLFGYWTTDFLVVQRVLAAKDLRSAKMAPIIGSAFKMLVPFIVILPGLLASRCCPIKPALVRRGTRGQRRLHGYNEVLPLMLARYCGPGLLGLGITALIAGFMSGMAGNVSAFATVWTYDIYGALIKKNATDRHKVAWVAGAHCRRAVSIGTAYIVMEFNSIMDYVQSLFSFFIAPLFGTVILGMLWKRATPAGGFWGLLAGTATSIGLWAWVKFDPGALNMLHSRCMRRTWRKTCTARSGRWLVCVIVTVIVSLMTKPKTDAELKGLVYGVTDIPSEGQVALIQRPLFWGVVVAVAFLIVNVIFW